MLNAVEELILDDLHHVDIGLWANLVVGSGLQQALQMEIVQSANDGTAGNGGDGFNGSKKIELSESG
jgi:hypothetical protein